MKFEVKRELSAAINAHAHRLTGSIHKSEEEMVTNVTALFTVVAEVLVREQFAGYEIESMFRSALSEAQDLVKKEHWEELDRQNGTPPGTK